MNQERNKHAMTYGLLMGVVFSINFYLSTVPAISFLQYLVFVVVLVLSYRFATNCRDKVCGGVMSYGSALFYIVQLFSYAALILALFKYIFYTLLAPNYLDSLLELFIQIMDEAGLSNTMFGDTPFVEMFEKVITPLNLSLQSIWVNILYGLIVGLIMAAFVKKEKSIFEDKTEVEA
ncbi:MAG: DUF4199 domain-containing protein [bacterium]